MKVGKTTRMPESRCPQCGRILTAATCVTDTEPEGMPEPGSGTVCIQCGTILVVDESLRLRLPSGKELIELAGDPRIITIMWAIKERDK